MSMLTKAFVVLVTVLSVVLVALTVSFVASVQDYETTVRDLERQVMVAEASARTTQRELDNALAGRSELIAQLNARNDVLQGQLRQLQTDLDQAQAQARSERAALTGLEASVAELAAAGEQQATLLDKLSAELRQRREEAVSQQTKLIESIDRIAELEGQLESLSRQVRQFQQRMVALQEQNRQYEELFQNLPEDVRSRVVSARAGDEPVATPTLETPVAGQVTQVERVGEDVLVQINVGSADGVKEQVEFLVHRGDSFLGTMVVDVVNENTAVGRMTLIEGDIQQGDRVYTGPISF